MTDFHNIRFPQRLAFGAEISVSAQTDIVQMASGGEIRNRKYRFPKRRYNARIGVKDRQQIIEIKQFYMNRYGSAYSFRFQDPVQNSTAKIGETVSMTDVEIGLGDGQTKLFSLVSSMPDHAPASTYILPESVQIAINGQAVSEDEYILDAFGQIEFLTPPEMDATLTAGFDFDIIVRFDMSDLRIEIDDPKALSILDIPLVEVVRHA